MAALTMTTPMPTREHPWPKHDDVESIHGPSMMTSMVQTDLRSELPWPNHDGTWHGLILSEKRASMVQP